MTQDSSDIDYATLLLDGSAAVAVWGVGHIGISTLKALNEQGIRAVGYDIDPARVDLIQKETDQHLTVTTDMSLALAADVLVHFIAVPTERNAAPWHEAMTAVFKAICAHATGTTPLLVIVESTLAPGTTRDRLLPEFGAAGLEPDVDLLLAFAPRRDWLTSQEHGLRDLDRVYFGVGSRSRAAAQHVLSILCRNLHAAPSYEVGELVKCVENAYRHVEISLANQLTLGFPDVDIVEALRLAATKWNIGLFHPSFGTGGYCIPLSSQYLLLGASKPEELSLLSDAIDTDAFMRERLVRCLVEESEVLILGLAYKGGLKVATLSPTLAIADWCRTFGIQHQIFDPLYTKAETERISGSPAVDHLDEAVRSASAVVVVTDHPEFRTAELRSLLIEPRASRLLIVDNYGWFEDWTWPEHVEYRRAGRSHWLGESDGPASLNDDRRI